MKNSQINFDDRNFLSRYAEYVTDFGDKINFGDLTDGYGIWRLVKADAEKIISNKDSRASDVTARSPNDSFSKFINHGSNYFYLDSIKSFPNSLLRITTLCVVKRSPTPLFSIMLKIYFHFSRMILVDQFPL